MPLSKPILIKELQYEGQTIIKEVQLDPRKFRKYFDITDGKINYDMSSVQNVMKLLEVPIITFEVEPTPDLFIQICLFDEKQFQYTVRFKKLNKKSKKEEVTGWYSGINSFSNPWRWYLPEQIKSALKKSRQIGKLDRDRKTHGTNYRFRLEPAIL